MIPTQYLYEMKPRRDLIFDGAGTYRPHQKTEVCAIMSASQYLLPTGYANTPVAAADGSLWVNHFSGLFRLYHGETSVILTYRDDEQGLTWMPSAPLNPYYSHHSASLPSRFLLAAMSMFAAGIVSKRPPIFCVFRPVEPCYGIFL